MLKKLLINKTKQQESEKRDILKLIAELRKQQLNPIYLDGIKW